MFDFTADTYKKVSKWALIVAGILGSVLLVSEGKWYLHDKKKIRKHYTGK